jgi:hypothetical protein
MSEIPFKILVASLLLKLTLVTCALSVGAVAVVAEEAPGALEDVGLVTAPVSSLAS